MDINPSNSADRASEASPTTIHANHSPLLPPLMLPHPRCPTMQSDGGSWILITASLTRFRRLRIPLPWSYQHLVSPLCLKSLGRTLTRTSTCSSTSSLVQDSPFVGSLDTQGSLSRLYSRKRCALSVTYLLTAFHDPIDAVAAHLVHLAKLYTNSSDFGIRFHRNDGPFRRGWLLRAVKDADWAEVST